MEGVIPDLVCKDIIDREFIPNMKNDSHLNGIRSSLKVLKDLAKKEYSYKDYQKPGLGSIIGGIFAVLVLILVIYAMIKGGTGGGTTMGDRGYRGGYWGGYGGGLAAEAAVDPRVDLAGLAVEVSEVAVPVEVGNNKKRSATPTFSMS